ncbi:MAG: hypothetical protein ABJA34_03390 [Pseudonocardiales bacterium]
MPDSGGATTTDVARQEAAGVAQSASDAAQHVGSTAKEQAASVVSEAKEQGQRLAYEARQQVSEQATTQRDRAAKGIRAVGEELRSMADSSEKSGLGTQLVRQVADNSHQVASYLEQHEPAQLLEDLRTFARRRPGPFLLGAALAGVVAGRLTSGIKSANASGGQGRSPRSLGTDYPAPLPATEYSSPAGNTDYLPTVGSEPGYQPAGAVPVAEPLAPTPFDQPYGSVAGSYPTEGYSSGWTEPAGQPDADQPGTDQGYGPVNP